MAGFRWRGAVAAFLSSTFVCLVVGAGTAFAISSSGLVESGLVWLEGVPGGLGAAFAPLLVASPWILFTLIGFVPWLVVRSARRERAIREAETLQVKLVFPLVICCLPGLFVITLGPAFSELFEVLEGVIQSNVGSR